MNINLGDLAKDRVTGFTGVVVAHTRWLNGCPRITLQPRDLDPGGKPKETQTFDELQCEIVEAGAVPCGNANQSATAETGGPRDDKAALRR